MRAGQQGALYQPPLSSTLARFPRRGKYDSIRHERRFAALEDRMGAAVKVTRMDHTAPELRALAAKSKDTAQARRLLAIAMVLEGASRLDAARRTGMDRQTLRDWVHRYNDAAIEGLISRVAPGASTQTDRGANGGTARAGGRRSRPGNPPGDSVALRRSVRGGGPAVFGHGAGTHDRQMAAQARADPVATAPLSSREGRSGPAGF